jgi:formamidopyrimidine-DNA glycosylase
MPELPEVQTVVDQLGRRLSGRAFAAGTAFVWPGTAGYPEAALLAAELTGRRVLGVRRRAKYILIDLDDGRLLVIHLRMTGFLHFAPPGAPDHRHLRARLPLESGEELRFADMRKFGRFYLGTLEELSAVIPLASLGPEPLASEFTPETLGARLAGRGGAVKSVLLDQRVLAGLGNIYADEALFQAGIDPRRPARGLGEAEIAALHAGIVAVLRQALGSGGTTFRDYRGTEGLRGENEPDLQVFHRQGRPCPRCGATLLRCVVGGRGTHFCPSCQQ